MKIGGLRKVSLIDYPGMICAVVFVQGCNFRCSYCHNPELVMPELFQSVINEKEILNFLATRRGKLDAVTITGGEPTIQKGLLKFIKQIKKLDFAVKLDTNGYQPQIIQALLREKLLDYIAMDIKGPLGKYEDITRVKVNTEIIKDSIKIILDSMITHEFRTTVVKSQLTINDILKISAMISGTRKYALQKFVSEKTLEKKFLQEQSYADEEMEKIKKRLEKEIPSVIVR
jgi:pyruvate formate lyase activating enzyme